MLLRLTGLTRLLNPQDLFGGEGVLVKSSRAATEPIDIRSKVRGLCPPKCCVYITWHGP